LRNEFKRAGVRFATDTDTEVIAHLVNQQLKKGCEPVDAVRVAAAAGRSVCARVPV
jgi:glucosamine--fructose-6-phosphate aminotransferase (isomerizing)